MWIPVWLGIVVYRILICKDEPTLGPKKMEFPGFSEIKLMAAVSLPFFQRFLITHPEFSFQFEKVRIESLCNQFYDMERVHDRHCIRKILINVTLTGGVHIRNHIFYKSPFDARNVCKVRLCNFLPSAYHHVDGPARNKILKNQRIFISAQDIQMDLVNADCPGAVSVWAYRRIDRRQSGHRYPSHETYQRSVWRTS